CAGRNCGHGVEQWPVGNRVGAIEHRFGLTVWRCHGAGVEVVAANDERCGNLAFAQQVIKEQNSLVSLVVAEPADTCWQTFAFHVLFSGVAPLVQMLIVGEEFLERGSGDLDVFWVARKCSPAKWAETLAE